MISRLCTQMLRKEELFKVAMEKLKKNKKMINDSKSEDRVIIAKWFELLYKILKTMSMSSSG